MCIRDEIANRLFHLWLIDPICNRTLSRCGPAKEKATSKRYSGCGMAVSLGSRSKGSNGHTAIAVRGRCDGLVGSGESQGVASQRRWPNGTQLWRRVRRKAVAGC